MIPISLPPNVADVPYHSQITEIASHTWQLQGCGITSLAMIIDYYNKADTVSVESLLKQGIVSGAFINNVGWSYDGLIKLSKKYDLDGKTYDLAKLSSTKAFAELKNQLKDGPVIVSIHYKFDPKNTLPHMIVIDGIDNDVVYYNNPSGKAGVAEISSTKFLAAWKKRFIVIRPATPVVAAAQKKPTSTKLN